MLASRKLLQRKHSILPQGRGCNRPQHGAAIDFSQSWVLGFEVSRQEGELSLEPAELYPERDVYRHTERQGQVQMQFTKLHDIYALGVVLLEIGKLNQSSITLLNT